MKKVLVVIDMQNDFIDQALGTKEAVEIVPEVVRLIEEENVDKVYATQDTHHVDYLETFEGKHLPVEHCIMHTEGWQINPQVKEALEKRNATIVEKPTFGSVTLAKEIQKENPDEIIMCGLCTDICVASNALLLRAYLPETKITIVEKACAGTTPENHDHTLAVMKSCQIDVC